MTDVECGIKAYDVHELYCHFLAERLGYYADEGLRVRVIDVTFVPDEKLPQRNYFQVACGAAYLGRREGFPFKVVLAAATRPMFWLHARPEIESVEALRGARVATYPPVAPPHWFHRLLLRKHGLDPDRDLEFWPCRDDIIRLGLLRGGDIDAALLSSATSPITVQRLGFKTLALSGDEVRFVTTGVATFESILEEQSDVIEAVVRAHRRGLDAIHEQPDEAIAALADVLDEPDDVARETFELMRHCFTRDGVAEQAVLHEALANMADVLPAAEPVEPADLYDFSLLERVTA
ncbi:MAG TPA: ABC transporter substrate-binding protein [Gaiellaceae bacterium]|jgi:ABC-type nitrate/sulfonate/bicarbonate transport system substrate-binding protein